MTANTHRAMLSESAQAMAESLADMDSPSQLDRDGRAWCRQQIVQIANTLIHAATADMEHTS